MNQHTRRLIVGVVLLVLIIPSIMMLSSITIAGIFALLCVGAAYEWGKLLVDKDDKFKQRLYTMICVLATLAIASFSIYYDNKIILFVAVLWWFIALVISTFYRTALCSNIVFRYFLFIHIIIALAACNTAIYVLHQMAWQGLLYAVILTAASDASAYYAGRRIGKNKLAPTISSGKTKEGLWGALLATMILGLSTAALFPGNATALHMISWVLLSLVACIAGVIGDLTESMAKRCANVKDSGSLLPGHGGLLDRIDAFIAVAPVLALGLLYR